MKFFKIYVCVSLFIIVLLLGALVGELIYAGNKVKNETTTVSSKVDSFNQGVNNINTSLKDIKSQLQTQNTNLSQRIPTL